MGKLCGCKCSEDGEVYNCPSCFSSIVSKACNNIGSKLSFLSLGATQFATYFSMVARILIVKKCSNKQ
jgi:hypothetical protein